MPTSPSQSFKSLLDNAERSIVDLLKDVPILAEKHNLSSKMFNWWTFQVSRVFNRNKVPAFVASLSLFAICLAVFLMIYMIMKQPMLPTLPHVVFFLGIGVFALWIVWRAYHYLVPKVVTYAIELPYTDDERKQLLKWFGSMFNLRKQFVGALMGIAFLELVWGLMDLTERSFPTSLSSYIAVAFGGFFVSQGAYWLIWAPTYLTVLSRLRLKLQTLDPVESPHIKGLARLVMWFILACGLTFALGLTLFLFVWPYTRSLIVLALVYLVASGLIVYFFMRSNLDLTRIIRKERTRVMSDIQGRIAKILESESITEEDLALVDKLWTLYSKVKSTKGSTFSVSMFRTLSGSIFLQTLPLLIKIFMGINDGKTFLESISELAR